MVRELIISPFVLLSLDADLIVVSDEQLSYAVLGAESALIDCLDGKFGGTAAYRQRLSHSIETAPSALAQKGSNGRKNFCSRGALKVPIADDTAPGQEEPLVKPDIDVGQDMLDKCRR